MTDPEVKSQMEGKILSMSNTDLLTNYLIYVLGENPNSISGTEGSKYRFTDTGGGDVTLQIKNEEGGWENVHDEANEYSYGDVRKDFIASGSYLLNGAWN
jgi:hypothetical protein